MARALDVIYAELKAAFDNSAAVKMAEEVAHQASVDAAKAVQVLTDEWQNAKAELVSVEQDVQTIAATIAGYM